jgi:signal transduction histidine kinase
MGTVPDQITACWNEIRKWAKDLVPGPKSFQLIDLRFFLRTAVEKAKKAAARRSLVIRVEGSNSTEVLMDFDVLRDVVDGLIRNAIENTPDGGMVTVSSQDTGDQVLVHVTDTGVGITDEDQQYIFDGLHHAKDTELYSSREPYEFNAGGKGLDLLRMKMYAERFGFGLSVKSSRCARLLDPTEECLGDIALCSNCTTTADCYQSGSTTFTVALNKSQRESRPVEKPV